MLDPIFQHFEIPTPEQTSKINLPPEVDALLQEARTIEEKRFLSVLERRRLREINRELRKFI